MTPKIFSNHGFDYPPVGLMSVLEKLPGSGVFYIIDPLNGPNLPYDHIRSQDKTDLFVIITTHEPACHLWFDRLIDQLLNYCQVPNDHVILHSGCLWDPGSPIKHVGSPVDELTDFLSRFDVRTVPNDRPNLHYVCLNRVPRWQRKKLVQKLLDRDLVHYGSVSHGPVPGDTRFPLIVDRPNPTYDDGYIIDSGAIRFPTINVITESCYEPEPGSTRFESHPRPGLTEKTYKSIILAQLPIFLAPYRTVSCYRDLGFDAFDDIIDHSYDLEIDPVIRIDQIVNEIDRQCSRPLINYRDQLNARFQKNLDLLHTLRGNYDRELPQWREIISSS